MTDSALRVPGYSEGTGYGSEDDDEFDIIEMTPRAPPEPRDAFEGYSQSSRKPPAHPVSMRSVAPLNLHLKHGDSDDSPEIATPEHPFSTMANVGPGMVRDPSVNSEAQTLQSNQPGVFGTGFLSGIAKALVGQGEDPSPVSVKEAFMKRRKSGISDKAPNSPSVTPMSTGLHDGEEKGKMKELVFLNSQDPEAVEFAKYLKDDGDVLRTPVLCMCDYGIGQFASDLWVLPHNAMRRELFDLYEIMSVVRSRFLSLTWGDVYKLRRWWRFLSYFWRQYLVIEDELLNPMVDAVLDVDGRCDQIRTNRAPLNDDREWISLKFEEVNAYMEEFERLPRSKVLGLICQTTDALGFRMLGYFNGQERILPPLIANYHDESIKLTIEQKMLEIYRNTNHTDESIVHLVRWMELGKERDKWLVVHLWWGERSTLGRMYKKYNDNHGGVVDSFRKKIGGKRR